MPQFWKIDALQWINPEHIVHVEDSPHLEAPTVRVNGGRLYTLVERPRSGDHLLELRFTPGVAAYAFTFG